MTLPVGRRAAAVPQHGPRVQSTGSRRSMRRPAPSPRHRMPPAPGLLSALPTHHAPRGPARLTAAEVPKPCPALTFLDLLVEIDGVHGGGDDVGFAVTGGHNPGDLIHQLHGDPCGGRRAAGTRLKPSFRSLQTMERKGFPLKTAPRPTEQHSHVPRLCAHCMPLLLLQWGIPPAHPCRAAGPEEFTLANYSHFTRSIYNPGFAI